MSFILIVGGFDNTANFLTTGVMSLLHSDEQRELFLTDPDGLAPTAAEEVLRHGGFALGGPVGGGGGLVPYVATEAGKGAMPDLSSRLRLRARPAEIVNPSASATAGATVSFHGSLPNRLCASSRPRTVPGTPGAR